jgi:Flp pilus assembly protein TadD
MNSLKITLLVTVALGLFGLGQGLHAANEAQIVTLSGKGAKKEPEARWQKAEINQTVQAGGFVKTFAASEMGVLLADRSQLRLNQNSMMQIKTVADAEQWTQTQVKLHQGRAWSHARPVKAKEGQQVSSLRDAEMPPLSMETPTATLSIRGTVWLVDVDAQGDTQLVVLSGLVDIASEQGQLSVGSGEAARVERGKAPVKFHLTNPRDRVQWVTAWRPEPSRWLSAPERQRLTNLIQLIEQQDYALALQRLRQSARRDRAAARLLADIAIYQGELDRAIGLLRAQAAGGRGDPFASALIGHALLLKDQREALRDLLAKALEVHPLHPELLLLQGELALFEGEEKPARAAYGQVAQHYPDNPRGWLGLGVIESELEDSRRARRLLRHAVGLDEDFSSPKAELGTLETRSGNLRQAERLFDELLQTQPDDFIALTGQGMLRLKQGRPKQALESFLKAGIIEPDYARGWFYSGVAFYQLGERDRALEAFEQASQQDDKDPLPYLMRSRVQGDALEYVPAVRSAQKALTLMPNLKSINQLANDQKGSANLGSALADFGLETWANQMAVQSYSPFWAGSHLFMADRHIGLFNKNSELFQGFLTDPTVFGASNRFSHLVLTPGHYGRLDYNYQKTDWRHHSGELALNGYLINPLPLAYFVSGTLADAESVDGTSTGDGDNLTLGLGSKLTEYLGLFAFKTHTQIDADVDSAEFQDSRVGVENDQQALGLSYQFGPKNQLWLKAGKGKESSDLLGSAYLSISPLQGDMYYLAEVEQSDRQLRHSFQLGEGHSLTWGYEYSEQDKPTLLQVLYPSEFLLIGQERHLESRDLYVSWLGQPTPRLSLQADLFWQRTRLQQDDGFYLASIYGQPTVFANQLERELDELNPRLGLRYRMDEAQSLTLVGQQWRRPASVNSLSPVDTLGISVNDRLVSAGGEYQRLRAQYDRQLSPNAFLRLYADHEEIDNLSFAESSYTLDLNLEDLQQLQNKYDFFAAPDPYEETPSFAAGKVSSLGLNFNAILNERQSIALDLIYSDAEQTGRLAGFMIPFVPEFKARLSSHWSLPQRWLLGASATYRSERFEDERNQERLEAGWDLALKASWESPAKMLNLQFSVENILSDEAAGLDPDPHYFARASLRF